MAVIEVVVGSGADRYRLSAPDEQEEERLVAQVRTVCADYRALLSATHDGDASVADAAAAARIAGAAWMLATKIKGISMDIEIAEALAARTGRHGG